MELIGQSLSEVVCNMCAFHRKFLTRRRSNYVKMGAVYAAFVMCILADIVGCYNLDLETVTVHAGERDSMFGYSVALHDDQGSKWLLVGAPRAPTRQPGVTRGGAVYRCPLDNRLNCQQIPFDTKGNEIRHNGTHYRDVEDKSDQWFGASLYSSSNGTIVACAPRYVYFSSRLDKREPVGTCYVARPSSTDYEEYSPCKSRVDGLPLIRDQTHKQGYCQLGFSAVLTSQGRQLLIGAPGSWYWQGQLFNFNFEDGPGRYKSTPEGQQNDDYSYMGYSMAVGQFDSDDIEDYAVGVPRGRQLQGKVVLYRQNLTIIDIIRGEQFGSYFGYSLAVTDIDKDGLDDVIVGAPLFSDYSTDNTYETGRVYIFYQDAKRSFTKRNKDVLDGHDSQSRFGLSVAAIGDIDYDNYNDIAVGAPYGGKNGRGVVYIYHGSMKGIITDVQQALHADDVIQEGAETFGWSLAGGMDMDENKYPDLMIGAYNSNRAALVRSRPVVRVTPTISVDPENITLSSENEICVINNGATKVQCITVNVCILFNGVGVPDQMDFQMNITFDSLKNDSSRMYFLHSETTREESKVERAYKGVPKCERFFGYLVKNIRDKLTPIVTDFSFDIVDKAVRRSPREVRPILNQRSPTTIHAEANIMKNCGQDNVCIPDLTITAMHTHDSYTLGEEKELDILVFVTNKGEDAFESILNITVPEGVEFRKIKDKKYEIPIFCNVFNKSFISCDLGNPLPAKSRTNFTLVALPKNITGNEPEMVFRIAVNSSNAENISDYRNNVAEIKIPLQQAANLRIGGKPVPEQFVYTESDVRQYRQKGVQGPVIEHRYFLNNRGPTGVKTAMLTIDWPGQDENGLNFLYMDQTPIVSRPDISCILLNKTYTKYSEGPDSDTVIIDQRDTGDTSQVKRHKREATGQSTGDDTPDKRDVQTRAARELKTIKCEEGKLGCVHVQCTIGEIKPYQSVNITIRAKIWTSTIVHKKLQQPFYFVSKAKAEVLAMPFKMKIASSTLSLSVNEISTYVNPERLHPQRKGIEPWIIGVSIAAGLLVLLLLIVLLWWCGFFRRRRPEERAFLTSAAQNGDFSPVNDRVPDSKYKYT
ncbi:integrin alpha-8-like isoform X1 [Mya arenaria]|uniref:integrin alpha-8-like isoform X1 n=1 Tax=Mya arenaria TaxID=6604 RepID=UPI0022E709AF|nr:integrin alpha-8-like isoform X1 [Mya arenaria]